MNEDGYFKYDDYDFHFGNSDNPELDREEWSVVHMVVFVRLMFGAGFEGEPPNEHFASARARFMAGKMDGADYLFEYMDGKITSLDFNEAGNRFARAYYDRYLVDFENHAGITRYREPEDNVNMEAIEDIFDSRLSNFLQTGDLGKETR